MHNKHTTRSVIAKFRMKYSLDLRFRCISFRMIAILAMIPTKLMIDRHTSWKNAIWSSTISGDCVLFVGAGAVVTRLPTVIMRQGGEINKKPLPETKNRIEAN